MNKVNKTNMVIDSISKRRSTFAFSAKPVEQEKLMSLFEAAHLAPSSMNMQPWRFIYAIQDNPEEFQLLFDCLHEGNQQWCKNVPVLVLSIAEMGYTYKDEHYSNKYAWHDVGTSMGMLMIQAISLGLVTHPMGGFDPEKARKNLHINEPFEPVAMIAIGYPGATEKLPEDLLKRETSERKRNPLSEIVFKGKFTK